MGLHINISITSGFREKLESWHDLEAKKRLLEQRIAKLEDRLARLRADLAASTQRAITYDKDRVQGGMLYDATADFVADMLERIERTELELATLRHDYDEVCSLLEDIERMVREIKPEYQSVLTLYYRDGKPWHEIEARAGYSKSRIYEILDETAASMEGGLGI